MPSVDTMPSVGTKPSVGAGCCACCSSSDAGADASGAGFLPLLPVRTSVPGADALRFGVTVALALGVDAVIGVDGASMVCWVGMRCLFLKLDISPLSSPNLNDLCGVVARGVVGPTLCSGETCCS